MHYLRKWSPPRAVQDNADSAELCLLFASKTITRLKSQQAPEGQVPSVTHEEMHYTLKELLEFSDLHREKSGEHVWK